MAKISPVSIKYTVTADFQAEGPVQKPDVIGALFGQTEGLLGTDMELRELQKEGKIGRIEVELESENGKTKGEIIIPSALDKTETTIVAAALETIDKIGPTDAKITITEIEDVRGSKRDYIMDRAKKLLAGIKGVGMETKEMEQELRDSARTSKIAEYGEERLPAGDLSGKEIVVVEGRADVVNMLRCGVNNVIGMNGTRLPKEIAKLSKDKDLILFVDGDRGGKLIAKNVVDNADVKKITSAPDGKEVEELTGKEIHQALRKAVSVKDFFKNFDSRDSEKKVSDKTLTKEDKDKLKEILDDLEGRSVAVLNEDLKVVKETQSSKLLRLRIDDAFVVLANNATGSVLSGAEKLGAKYVGAKKFSRTDSDKVELVSL